ncbi:hypothetical protein FH972_014629 [Carpinus fangiana]|uniref:Diacylglycerol O-acyltransferase n=1 Tax=Carpinus fangiana TaxID=176857 RepID=A0A5N6RAY4_9ROSI|nr:hypothetical protein FH972_014629 [Carpinus fangiana]
MDGDDNDDEGLNFRGLCTAKMALTALASPSSVTDRHGDKQWKRVEVKLEDHVSVPIFPAGWSPTSYDEYFDDYLSKIALDRFPQSKPLFEIHIFKYPTSNAAGNIIFKLHHSLGDGYSLMGALLSCLQRADNPSAPLTLPSRPNSGPKLYNNTI